MFDKFAAQLELTPTARRLWQRYGDPLKQCNALRLQQLKADCAVMADAWPWRIVLEPHHGCNLHCPGCGAHAGDLPAGSLSVEGADLYLRELWPYLVQVNLFHFGEPLLNPHLPEIIALVHGHGVGTQVHSNGQCLDEPAARQLIESGLDQFVISIDAASQPTYERYRVGGSLEAAVASLRLIVGLRRRMNRKLPLIQWKYVLFEHNRGEVDAARNMAADVGADEFVAADGYLAGQRWTLSGPVDLKTPATRPSCPDLWDLPVVGIDGRVLPCCLATEQRFAWGDLRTQAWIEAFNSEPFMEARRLASGDASAKNPCAACYRCAAIAKEDESWKMRKRR